MKQNAKKFAGLGAFLGMPLSARFIAARAGDEFSYQRTIESLARRVRSRWCQLIVDGGCNQNCVHCCLGQTSDKTPTHSEQIQKVGEDLHAQGFKLDIYPAEPLMTEEILKTYARFWAPGVSDFLTNGTAPLARMPITKLVPLLQGYKIREIWISVHGASRHLHEQITRVPGSFDAALDFIRKLGSLPTNENLRVSLMICVNKENIRELPAILDIAVQNNIYRVYVMRLVVPYHGEVPANLVMNRQATWDALTELNHLRLLHKKRVKIILGQSWGVNFHNPGIYRFLTMTHVPFCFAMAPRLTVHPGRLKVYPCHTMSGCPEMEVGSLEGSEHVLKLNSLGNQLVTWHREWQDKARGECAVGTCPFSEICHGGCRGTALAPVLKRGGTPDWFVGFPDCITTLLEEMT